MYFNLTKRRRIKAWIYLHFWYWNDFLGNDMPKISKMDTYNISECIGGLAVDFNNLCIGLKNILKPTYSL